MSLSEEERQIVVNLELEKAQKTFAAMEVCAHEECWESAANRMYYALFHAVAALLINDGHQVKSHRGVMALFGEYYIRTSIFTKKDGALFSDLVVMHNKAQTTTKEQGESRGTGSVS